MNNLTAVVLINRDAARVSRSALPDSPVVPEPEPGRARLLVAEALYRLATRLDRGRLLLAHDRQAQVAGPGAFGVAHRA